MENKDCYTLGDLKKYIAECTLSDETPIVITRESVEGEDGGHDVEAMAMLSIGDNGNSISFTCREDSLSNNDLEIVFGECF